MRNHGGPAVALVGTTASGKSALAHQLCLEQGDVSILCVDAMTVYRGMDLGTAKPSLAQRDQVSYHLVDLIEPSEEFTLYDYQQAARDALVEIWQLGGAALYVGGTGLYGRAVLDDFEIPRQYPEVRAALEERCADLAGLYEELARLDPLAASRMEPTNERRIVRALEVTLGSGRLDFAVLDDRIERRFREWMDQGLLDEVRAVAQRRGGLSRTARQAVGYRELLRHLEQGEDLEECVRDAITQSKRLARRQRSWFARDPRIEWFDDVPLAAKRLVEVLNSPDGFVRD